MPITFNDCLQEHYSKEGSVRFSKKLLRQLSFGIKLLYDKNHPNSAKYLQVEENGVSMSVRVYPDAFKNTMMGIIEKNDVRVKERRRMIEEEISAKKNKVALKYTVKCNGLGNKPFVCGDPVKKLRKRKNHSPVYSAKPKQL